MKTLSIFLAVAFVLGSKSPGANLAPPEERSNSGSISGEKRQKVRKNERESSGENSARVLRLQTAKHRGALSPPSAGKGDSQAGRSLFSPALDSFFDFHSSYFESAGLSRLALLGGIHLSYLQDNSSLAKLKVLERRLGLLKSRIVLKIGTRVNLLSSLNRTIAFLEDEVERTSREINQTLLGIKMASERILNPLAA